MNNVAIPLKSNKNLPNDWHLKNDKHLKKKKKPEPASQWKSSTFLLKPSSIKIWLKAISTSQLIFFFKDWKVGKISAVKTQN